MFTFTNELQMPSYLGKDQFSIWLQKANLILAGPVAPDSLNIEFSDEEKAVTYGLWSIEEIKNLVREQWMVNEQIEGILIEIQSLDDYHNRRMASPLAEEICACNRDATYKSTKKTLANMFAEAKFTEHILGEYCHDTKTITLYTKAIEGAAGYGRTIKQNFEVVFVHELFHAYHYASEEVELLCRWDYTANVIKESLAAAFEWNYCVVHKIPGVNELRQSWEIHSVIGYPYSGASYLIDRTQNVLLDNDFYNVFQLSSTDMDGALRALLSPVLFYATKNKKTIDLRLAFDKLMKKDAIGTIAHREITSIIRKTENRHLIPLLMDLTYSNTYFHATQYPILATEPMLDKAGRKKSYTNPIHRFGKKEFYLSAQWDEDQLDLLLDWIWTHR